MFSANTYVIRYATSEEARALGRYAELDPAGSVTGRTLVGEIAGRPAAAVMADGRVVTDPFRATSHLVANLRLRAGAVHAYERTPSLAERMLAAVRVQRPTSPAPA